MATPLEPGSPATEENQLLLKNLGAFTALWSSFDVLIDTAIMKLLKLSPIQGAIVSPNLGFQAKLSILQSLLNLEADKNAPTLAALASISNMAGRNSIIHGHVHIGDDWIEFIKVDVKTKITAKKKRFENYAFEDHLHELYNLIEQAQRLLGISDDDLEIIPNIGKSLASKSATSPSPPSAK
jgi:hypothetical protein